MNKSGQPFRRKPAPPSKAKRETLVAVAFQRDGQTHHGFKVHWELRASIGDENPQDPQSGDVLGFWTSDDRFVTRREAVPIAIESRQIGDHWHYSSRELLSSDVKWTPA